MRDGAEPAVEISPIRLLIGFAAFVVLSATAILGPWGAGRIASDLETRVNAQLSQAGFDWAKAKADGRIVALSGEAPHPGSAASAASAIAGIKGLSRIETGMISTVQNRATPADDPIIASPVATAASVKAEPHDCARLISKALDGRGITFLSNSVALSRSDRLLLDAIAGALSTCGETMIIIEGHTDAAGSPESNQALSEMRAGSVKEYLDSLQTKTTFIARGYGEDRPIASNKTSAGRRANRRIDFVVAPQTESEPSQP